MMLRKKETFTVVTPIPGFIPRQLAIDIHAHSEVITLKPLVLHHRPIAAPRTAAADEFYSTWYEIVERIRYLPGVGGNITFCGCFHDMPWGLQTHIYAPMNVDLRNRYRIAGNQPGVEPPDPHREIGLQALGAPSDCLYLHEDIEIKCNVALMGFVKAQIRKASKEMVQCFIKKAQLLDAGILHAMMDAGGKLRTVNPNDRSRPLPRLDADAASYALLHSPPASPSLLPLAAGSYGSHPAGLPYKQARPSSNIGAPRHHRNAAAPRFGSARPLQLPAASASARQPMPTATVRQPRPSPSHRRVAHAC